MEGKDDDVKYPQFHMDFMTKKYIKSFRKISNDENEDLISRERDCCLSYCERSGMQGPPGQPSSSPASSSPAPSSLPSSSLASSSLAPSSLPSSSLAPSSLPSSSLAPSSLAPSSPAPSSLASSSLASSSLPSSSLAPSSLPSSSPPSSSLASSSLPSSSLPSSSLTGKREISDSLSSESVPPRKYAKSTPSKEGAKPSSLKAGAKSSRSKGARHSKRRNSARPTAHTAASSSATTHATAVKASLPEDASPSTDSSSITSDAIPSTSSGPSLPPNDMEMTTNDVDIGSYFAGLSLQDRFSYGNSSLEGYVAWQVNVNAELTESSEETLHELCEVGFMSNDEIKLDSSEEIAGRDKQAFTVRMVASKLGELRIMCKWGTNSIQDAQGFKETMTVKLGFAWKSSSKKTTVYLVDKNEVLWDGHLKGFKKTAIYPIFRLGKAVQNNKAIVTLELLDGSKVSSEFKSYLQSRAAEPGNKGRLGDGGKSEKESNESE